MKKITVVGAGIGGLTTAIALKKQGFEVEIFETTPEFKKAGSGINLAMNAMQVFKSLGVYEDILKHSNYTNQMNSTTQKLKVLGGVNFGKSEQKYNVVNVAIHRAALHEVLVDHLGDTPIHLGKKLKSLVQKDNKVFLYFEDGSEHVCDVVIGADGIHSAVRTSTFKNTELRDAEQVCWRGISNIATDKKYDTELNEAWGKESRFGFVHIAKNKVYWYALINKSKFTSKEVELTELFKEYDNVVHQIIKCTPKQDILFNEIWDLNPIDTWYKGNVCLVGDAAHATTPNMGQGACQAVESAFALSICLSEEKSLEDAFKRYQALRMEKANYIVQTSWKLGKLAQTPNPFVRFLRNLILRLVPSSVGEKQNQRIFSLHPELSIKL